MSGQVDKKTVIKDLLEKSREDFEKDATNNGDIKVEDVLKNALLSEMADILENN